MKKILPLIFLYTTAFATDPAFHCPLSGLTQAGKTPSTSKIAENKLKNRSTAPASIDSDISLEKILASGKDATRFKNSTGATITGFIVGVKSGGGEDCNCFYGKDPFIDTHIEIALTDGPRDDHHLMVVEMTPRFKKSHASWRTDQVKALIGKKVKVTGWMFYDQVHGKNSVNTAKPGTKAKAVYRTTAWEIHPVTDFEVVN